MLKKKGFVWVAVMICCFLAAALWMENRQGKRESIPYPAFAQAVKEGRIATVYYSDDAVWKAVTTEGAEITVPNPRNDGMKENLMLKGIDVVERQEQAILPLLLFMGILVFMIAGRRTGMDSYARTDAQKQAPGKTFADVIISPETLRAMEDLTHYLKWPEHYVKMGARPPRGVLLYGPPGTGKTLLAQALAGETGKPFYAVSGSDFVQVYVGVGASRIRNLFKKARKAGGGVIFIDEIDALGKKRDNGNDEREQTLNALLTEMNGFAEGEGIIVLAATNRPETLDAALLREGRFDRRIEIGLPDVEERRKMLEVHSRNKPMDMDVDLDTLARETVLFSGAQLESLMNEAAIRAIREGKETIGQVHLQQAFIAQIAGEERKKSLADHEKRIIAVHEAGHALATYYLLPENVLRRVTIIPSSKGAAGYSLSVQKEKRLLTGRDMLLHMTVALAGRAAEATVFGRENVTNGAENDLEKAEQMAKQMYGWRMTQADNEKDGVRQAMEKAEEKALLLLDQKRETLDRLTEALMEKETLLEVDLMQILAET